MPNRRADDGGKYDLLRAHYGTFIALTPAGTTALLIPVSSGAVPVRRATGGVALSFATVDFDVAPPFRSRAAIIECVDETLIETFLILATSIAAGLRADVSRPNPQTVSAALSQWETLLRGRRSLTREEEAGLWGELWTLAQFANINLGVAFWRGPDAEAIDFVGGGIGVECKTSFRRHIHFVSQAQVTRPLGDFSVFLLSLWVTSDPSAGQSVLELVGTIERRLDDRSTFERLLLAYGFSRGDVGEYRLRLRNLEPPLFFPIADVPRVVEADPGVSSIRFVASLDERTAIPQEAGIALLARMESAR